MRFYLILSFAAVLLSSCASVPQNPAINKPGGYAASSTSVPAPAGVNYPGTTRSQFTSYAVQDGDTVWQIARERNFDPRRILDINNLGEDHQLVVGERILLPKTYRDAQGGFQWPATGKVIAGFNERINNVPNNGLEILAAVTDITASADGKVVFCDYINGWGKTLIIKHPQEFYTIYANLTDFAVALGRLVRKNEVIGQTSLVSRKPLHFEIRKNHVPRDPLDYLQ